MPPHFEQLPEQPSFRDLLAQYDKEPSPETLQSLHVQLEHVFGDDAATLAHARSVIVPLIEMPWYHRRNYITETYIQNLAPANDRNELSPQCRVQEFVRAEFWQPPEATGPTPASESESGDEAEPPEAWPHAA